MKIIRMADQETGKEKQFFKILLNESLIRGEYRIPRAMLVQVGSINRKLSAKRLYELLLRMTESYPVVIEESDASTMQDEESDDIIVQADGTDSVWDGIGTDCYIASRYREKLRKAGCFDTVLESILETAKDNGLLQEAAAYLEKMLLKGEEYKQIEADTCPVLIYKGESICHNVLNIFAEQFGAALERAGCSVMYFDVEKEGIHAITRFAGRHFKAVIGIQTYLFSVKMKDSNRFLHDTITGPKYNFIFDHPIWLKNHLMDVPQDFFVLTHDHNYVNFIRQYYGKRAVLFPPAGIVPKPWNTEKKYDISFVGTCGNYWNEIILIHQMERKQRFLANRFLLAMRKNPNMTAEDAMKQVLEAGNIVYTDQTFLDLFYEMRRVIYCVMHYYRYQVIKALAQSGLRLDVFGDSWRTCPLCVYPNFICHPDVSQDESMRVWQQSKLSLNIMSWHKGGFTERMANILLCGAVLATDRTTYPEGRMEDGKEAIMFDLKEIDKLPQVLKDYLKQPDKLCEMAQAGERKARAYHTWDVKAEEFLNGLL